MKRQLFVLAMLSGSAASGLLAQTVLQTGIPFDFAVGPSAMPAGEYRITCENNGLITLRELGGKHSAMVLTRPASTAAPGDRDGAGKLLFQRYGNEYFLLSVWKPSARDGLAVPVGVRQKELARRVAEPATTIVALR
jgi:hypothetical protein